MRLSLLLALISSPVFAEDACAPLKPGGSRVVAETSATTPRINERRYRVTRDAREPRRLNLDLNFKFEPSPEAIHFLCAGEMKAACVQKAPEELKAVIADRWLDKIRQCFATYRDILQDAAGTKLSVNVMSRLDEKSVPLAEVQIAPPGSWPKNFAWGADDDCTIFIHEALLWTGLMDGYPLDSDACRLVEPRESIYHSGSWALGPRVDISLCVCEKLSCRAEKCRIESGADRDCPKGYHSEERKSMGTAGIERLCRDQKNGADYKIVEGSLIKTVPRKEQPTHALYSMQLEAIEKPFCDRDPYFVCAANSYRKKSKDGCLPIPATCAGEWLK